MTVTPYLSFFFFNDTATTEIYTLSLHDALPICMHQEDLNVSVQNNVLTLEGKRTFAPVEHGQGTYQYSERASGTCCRRFLLSTAVNAAQITATYKQGVLDVHLPKAVEAQPKRIAVQAST